MWRWRRRNPVVAALAATVMLLLVLIAAGSTMTAFVYRRQVTEVRQAKADETEQLWQSLLAQARAGIASRRPGQRFDSLAAIEKAARIRPSMELRNAAIAAMALVDIRPLRDWDNVAGGGMRSQDLSHSTGAAFDPTFTYVATTDAKGAVHVRTVADQRTLVTLKRGVGDVALYLKFSPDGRYLAAVHGWNRGACRVWEWRTGRVVVEWQRDFGLAICDFHPDSQSVIMAGRRDGALSVFQLPDGKLLQGWNVAGAADQPVFEPGSGRRFAIVLADSGDVQIRDSQTGTTLAWWLKPGRRIQRLAWQPHGFLIAAASDDNRIYTFDVALKKPLGVLEGHQGSVKEITFHPSGSVLASWSWDSQMKFWDPYSGRELLNLPEKLTIGFRNDGKQMALLDSAGRIGVWEVAAPSECRLLYGHTGDYHSCLAFSPDSQVLASTRVTESAFGMQIMAAVWRASRWAGRWALPLNGTAATC